MPSHTYPGGSGTEVQHRSGTEFAAVTGSSFSGGILTLTTVVLAGTTVINEAGGDFDFRLEGDTDVNLIYADAGLDKVGFGKIPTTDSGKVHVKASDANKAVLTLTGATAQASFYLEALNASDVGLFWIDSVGSPQLANAIGVKWKNAAGTPGVALQVDNSNTWIATNPFDGNSVFGSGVAGTGSCFLQTQGANRVEIDADGNVKLTKGTTAGELRLMEPSGSGTNYVSLLSPARAANLNLTFPSGLPTVNQVLEAAAVTGSDITLGWTTAGSGSVATDTIWNVKGDLAVGTGSDTASRLAVGTNGFILSADSAEATGLKWISAPGGGDMLLGTVQVVTALKTFGAAGAVGKFALAGNTSGSTVVDASAVASGTLTLPAATDTLVGKATTDTLTNKTFDTAGAGNSFSINGVAVTANTGTGAVARASSPTFVTPTLGVASATSLATSAASPLLLTNGQLVTVALTSQTVGGTTLTIPDFASVVDEFTFKTKAQTMSNKTFVAPALGTPASGVLTNCTGTAAGLTAGTVTTNANLTGPITSVGNATSVAAQTGTGTTFVMNTSPTLVTPALGVATATSINKVALTAPATSATLTIADGKTLTASNTITFTATDGSTLAIGTGGTLGTAAYTASTAYQPVDATLTAFAALTIAAESLTIGTGADAFTQVTFAANTFPARASTGSLVAKTITDDALSVLDDANVAAMVNTLGGATSTGTGGLVRAGGPTLTGRTKTTSVYQDIVTDSVVSTTVTFDLSAGNLHQITLTASGWTFALSNEQTGQIFSIKVIQDGTGSRTIGTWFSTIRWAGGSAPTLTTTASKWDWFGFIRTGVGTYDGFVLGQNG